MFKLMGIRNAVRYTIYYMFEYTRVQSFFLSALYIDQLLKILNNVDLNYLMQ